MKIDKIKVEALILDTADNIALVVGRVKVYYCGFENCISIPIEKRSFVSAQLFRADVLDILRENKIIKSQAIRFIDLPDINTDSVTVSCKHTQSQDEFLQFCGKMRLTGKTALISDDVFCLFFKSGSFGTVFYKDPECTNFYCKQPYKRLRKEQSYVLNSYKYHCIPAPKEEESKRESSTIRYSSDTRELFYVSFMDFESGDTYVSFGNVANEIAKLEKYGYDVNVLLDSKHYRSRS